MARKYFGTDGIRGEVGQFPITPDFVMKLGCAFGRALVKADAGHTPTVIIGKDTRISGYMLETALVAGFTAAGVSVVQTGPLPTPGIAYLTRALRLDGGVMISASHNAFSDNGIKFFAEGGVKLSDEMELVIEAELDKEMQTLPSRQLGRAKRISGADDRYIEFCKSTFPANMNLRGLKLVVDTANGAGYHTAPKVFHELGAEVISIGSEPNGYNINDKIGEDGKFVVIDAQTITYDTLSNGRIYAKNLPGQLAKVAVDENETYLRYNFTTADNRNFRDGDRVSSKEYAKLTRERTEESYDSLNASQRANVSRTMYNSPNQKVIPDGQGGIVKVYDRSNDRTTLVDDESRVFKGGSWKDRAYYIDPAQRRFLPQYSATDYIGFRCAMSRVGSKSKKGKTSRG